MDFTTAFDSARNGGNGIGRQPPSGLDAFDSAEPAPVYQPLPGGIYPARIVSVMVTQTRKGADAYRVVFEVTEGDQRGRRLSRTWVFSDKAVGYAKRDLALFGLTTSKQLL